MNQFKAALGHVELSRGGWGHGGGHFGGRFNVFTGGFFGWPYYGFYPSTYYYPTVTVPPSVYTEIDRLTRLETDPNVSASDRDAARVRIDQLRAQYGI